ncbi:unnamed protein product, partial [Trichogramma brassicae]
MVRRKTLRSIDDLFDEAVEAENTILRAEQYRAPTQDETVWPELRYQADRNEPRYKLAAMPDHKDEITALIKSQIEVTQLLANSIKESEKRQAEALQQISRSITQLQKEKRNPAGKPDGQGNDTQKKEFEKNAQSTKNTGDDTAGQSSSTNSKTKKTKEIRCFGCGAPNVFRKNCPRSQHATRNTIPDDEKHNPRLVRKRIRPRTIRRTLVDKSTVGNHEIRNFYDTGASRTTMNSIAMQFARECERKNYANSRANDAVCKWINVDRNSTDASDTGLGAVLLQTINGEERVLEFASRVLSPAERNYTVTERECLGVIWAVRKFRQYIEGYEFTVVTDHASLRWLCNLRNPTGRLSRWALELQGHTYKVEHRKGSLNHVPDALSRIYEEDEEEITTLSLMSNSEDTWYLSTYEKVSKDPSDYPDWNIRGGKMYKFRPNNEDKNLADDDERKWKLVVQREQRPVVLRECHDEPTAAHLGREKTYDRLAEDTSGQRCPHRNNTRILIRSCRDTLIVRLVNESSLRSHRDSNEYKRTQHTHY